MSDEQIMQTIRALVVDDSAFMRKVVSEILRSDPRIEIAGTARNGQEALAMVEQLNPDVMTLDVQMPIMDGIQTLEALMPKHPMPVVVVSSMTTAGSQTTIRCLELGAFDFVTKPSGAISLDMAQTSVDLLSRVHAAVLAKDRLMNRSKAPRVKEEVSCSLPDSAKHPALVLIGASTGGPRALAEVFEALPENVPACFVVVQHMPAGFTRSLAERLDRLSPLTVMEAFSGAKLQAGAVYIAPGGYHVHFEADGKLRLSEEAQVNGVRPSIDVAMLSAARYVPNDIIGVVLTGMGSDGTAGVSTLAERGAYIIAESEETCVVFGMPKAAIQTGYVRRIERLESIPRAILEGMKLQCQQQKAS